MQPEHLAYLTAISKHLRAEPLLATLLVDEMGANDRLHFELKSTFRRPTNGDIADIVCTERESGKGQDITIQLNRDGFYDSLPEGLFYLAEREIGKPITADELRASQQAEADARIFFEPIEQAWLQLRLRSALDEERFDFFRIDQQFVSFFSNFWQLPARLDADLLKKLLLILPRLHEVAGNDAQM